MPANIVGPKTIVRHSSAISNHIDQVIANLATGATRRTSTAAPSTNWRDLRAYRRLAHRTTTEVGAVRLL